MAQFSKGDTFTNGEQVTGARLNQLVDSATLLAGAITDQTSITANTVASGDSILLYDLSATALREANVSDVLGSNVAITTSAITGGANSDILIAPNDGVIVIGQAYVSGDGLTVTVTSTAHLLSVGQVILIAGAGTGYNGTFRVAGVLTNSFSYVMTTAAVAGSGTLNYTKKGVVNNSANKLIAGNLYVDGSTALIGAVSVTGTLNVAGATTLGSAAITSLVINGKTPMTTQDNLSKYYVKSGQATGAWTTTTGEKAVWTSPTLPTPPSDETWIYEITASFTGGDGADSNTRSVPNSLIGKLYKGSTVLFTQSYSAGVHRFTGTTMTFTTSITSTDTAVVLSLKANNVHYGLTENPWYTVRLNKVKTANISDLSSLL
jgi:hypothetical protein